MDRGRADRGPGRGTLVVETLERIHAGLPFALRALDVDNVTKCKRLGA